MKKSYVVFNPSFSKERPIHVFDDYYQLVIWARRNKITGFIYWSLNTNEWDFAEPKDISAEVQNDAWNGFEDYRDANFGVPAT